MIDKQDTELLEELDRDFARVRERSGPWLACRPGCDECCHSLFPITRLDARRLRLGLAALEAQDRERAGRVVARARAAALRLSVGFPGDAATGRLVDDEPALDRFFERHEGLACPVLDPATGRCDLYDARPVACRVHGPPLRFAGQDSPPCRLCFDGAPPEVVERCRWTPDPHDREQRILGRLGVAPGEDWETLIAFGLHVLR